MINKLITEALSVLNIPVSFQTYSGEEDTYITFFCINEKGEAFADDKEVCTRFNVQVDLWSKSNYIDTVNQIVELLENKGFKRTSSADLYEKDTRIYHKAMRFIYAKNNE